MSVDRSSYRTAWLQSDRGDPATRATQADALRDVVDSGILQDPTGGPKVFELEREFADFVGVRHGVGTSSGTSALSVALVALGVGPGDEVVLPSFTFIASATAIRFAGATPIFADVEPRTMCMDPEDAEARLSERTKAIMPVHLLGYPADMDAIMALAREHDLTVVEDCCQGHGATVGNQKVGSIGDIGCFSFSKRHLISAGGGGVVTTDDKGLAERARRATFHGIAGMDQLWENGRDYDILGFNFGMSEFFAALALVELPALDEHLRKRAMIATEHDAVLAGMAELDPLPLPAHGEPCFHNYGLRVAPGGGLERDELADALREANVQLLVNLVPVHTTTVFAGAARLPVSEDVGSRTIVLELDHSWSGEEARANAKRVRDVIERVVG